MEHGVVGGKRKREQIKSVASQKRERERKRQASTKGCDWERKYVIVSKSIIYRTNDFPHPNPLYTRIYYKRAPLSTRITLTQHRARSSTFGRCTNVMGLKAPPAFPPPYAPPVSMFFFYAVVFGRNRAEILRVSMRLSSDPHWTGRKYARLDTRTHAHTPHTICPNTFAFFRTERSNDNRWRTKHSQC